jgi:DtxR family Mn-dependent transcriptional regulator
MFTQSIEDYIKCIYKLEENGRVSIGEISIEMYVAPSSVTKMVQRLKNLELVTHSSHKEVSLTESGKKAALKVLRRHRLLETFLVQVMGYTWDEVHDEACNLEHFISDKFENKIAELLNYPNLDPHGDPIPNHLGEIRNKIELKKLTEISEGSFVEVHRIKKDDKELLMYLSNLGLTPNSSILVLETSKFGGSIKFEINGKVDYVGKDAAEYIYVQ